MTKMAALQSSAKSLGMSEMTSRFMDSCLDSQWQAFLSLFHSLKTNKDIRGKYEAAYFYGFYVQQAKNLPDSLSNMYKVKDNMMEAGTWVCDLALILTLHLMILQGCR